MKRIVLLAALALVAVNATGCNSCRSQRSSCWSWFNRGDSCDTCPSGIPRGTMYGPSSSGVYGSPVGPEYLPGPASALPTG